jgi:hypothetical protein
LSCPVIRLSLLRRNQLLYKRILHHNDFFTRCLVLLSHRIRDHVFVYLAIAKCGIQGRSFSGSGDRNGRRFE